MNEDLAALVCEALYEAWDLGSAYSSYSCTGTDKDLLTLIEDIREAVLTYDGNTGGYK